MKFRISKNFSLLIFFFLIFPSFVFAQKTEKSICYGTRRDGRLENGIQLPFQGPNFIAYSSLGVLLGRTYVHRKVYATMVKAYESLHQTLPDKVFMYAETGLVKGGPFPPHVTHQNGLSVDFMVPVLNKKGESVPLPTSIFNKYGYNIEFDGVGNYQDYKIDYEAMAAHVVALHQAAKKQDIGIRKVIFDPKLQKFLLKTSYGKYLKKYVPFSKHPTKFRHDEHYHVDFKVKCQP